MSHKPNRTTEWLRQMFSSPRPAREGEESVPPHLEEFRESEQLRRGPPARDKTRRSTHSDRPGQ